MNIVITGGNGKLGQNIVERLQKDNEIFLITRNIKKSEKIFENKENLHFYNCNLELYNDIESCIHKIFDEFKNIIINTLKRGGKCIIPSSTVGKMQEILYLINDLSNIFI